MVAAAVVIALCCYLLITTSNRPKPKMEAKPSLTFKSIKELNDLTLAQRFYAEQKLRNGKRPLYLAGRFSRAATVC